MSALLTPADMSDTCTICLNDVGTANVTTPMVIHFIIIVL